MSEPPRRGFATERFVHLFTSAATYVDQVAAHASPGREYIDGQSLHQNPQCLHSSRVPKSDTRSNFCLCPNTDGGSISRICPSTALLLEIPRNGAGCPNTCGYDPVAHALRPILSQTACTTHEISHLSLAEAFQISLSSYIWG